MFLLHFLPDVSRLSESTKFTQVQPFPNLGIGHFRRSDATPLVTRALWFAAQMISSQPQEVD